jgi:hypothetical protein
VGKCYDFVSIGDLDLKDNILQLQKTDDICIEKFFFLLQNVLGYVLVALQLMIVGLAPGSKTRNSS